MTNPVEELSVSGEYVENLKDKTFTIQKAPHYENFPDKDNPEDKAKEKRQLVVCVKTSDGAVLNYYPNKTSVKTMACLRGADMDLWVGQMFEWKIREQTFNNIDVKVLYVQRKRFDDPKGEVVKAAVKA